MLHKRRHTKITAILTAFLLTAAPAMSQADSEPKPFAVIELYTSEGCSSCPPADTLFAEITSAARQSKSRIFPLSFHVDYWNNLGWEDPFSRKEFTRRQHRYAAVHNSDRVYTPQMIVNGKYGFAGYNLDVAQRTIDRSLAEPAGVNVRIEPLPQTDLSRMTVRYTADGNITKKQIFVALVERDITNFVRLGENSGRFLKHQNVVRAFQNVELKASTGEVILQIPEGVKMENTSVIAFVQDPKSMEIVGAVNFDL